MAVKTISNKKAKKIAQQQRLKSQRENISVQSNRQRKAEMKKAALQKFQIENQPKLAAVVDANGTTLGGPESHSMWL